MNCWHQSYILSLWTEEKGSSAGRGLQHERSKEVNLFQIYNMGFGNAMWLDSHVDPNESSFARRSETINLLILEHGATVENTLFEDGDGANTTPFLVSGCLGFYGRSTTPGCRRCPWGDLVVPTGWRRWGRSMDFLSFCRISLKGLKGDSASRCSQGPT
ncbi:hypothetical protein K1719_030025 [Acacia pycnantha]|nr:hypothetical protein K1719_030025 [Acacia pycnantha]